MSRVGPSSAKNIVRYRNQNGPFKSEDALKGCLVLAIKPLSKQPVF